MVVFALLCCFIKILSGSAAAGMDSKRFEKPLASHLCLPKSTQCLFEETDAVVNKHYLSESHVVQPRRLAIALNMAAP